MQKEFAIKEKWIDVNGYNIHYFVVGKGKPLVCLHGTGQASAWKNVLKEFPGNFQVIALDWPGYGKSSQIYIPHTVEFFIKILETFVKKLDLEKFSLVGHSMGGAITIGFTLKFPEKVEKLVLVDSYGLGNKLNRHLLMALGLKLPMAYDVGWHLMSKNNFVSKSLIRASLVNKEAATDEYVKEIQEAMKDNKLRDACKLWAKEEIRLHGTTTNYSGQLSKLKLPIFFLHGRKDRLFPVKWSQNAHQNLPNSKIKVFENTGHITLTDRPSEANHLILNFLLDK